LNICPLHSYSCSRKLQHFSLQTWLPNGSSLCKFFFQILDYRFQKFQTSMFLHHMAHSIPTLALTKHFDFVPTSFCHLFFLQWQFFLFFPKSLSLTFIISLFLILFTKLLYIGFCLNEITYSSCTFLDFVWYLMPNSYEFQWFCGPLMQMYSIEPSSICVGFFSFKPMMNVGVFGYMVFSLSFESNITSFEYIH